MPVYFKMSYNGLNDMINGSLTDDNARILLFNLLHLYDRAAVTMEQLFSLLDSKLKTDRKTATRLIYKMLHANWLENIEESCTLEATPALETEQDCSLPSLEGVTNNQAIILSEQNGLLISSRGFSSEQSVLIAAQVAEQLKLIKDSPSASENRLFPITGAFNYQDMKLDYRLIRLQKFCFLVTTRSNTLLDNQHYFNLIANLVRRYDIEYKRAA